jgi:hypothetical protein
MEDDKWRPITDEELRDLLEVQLAACAPERRELFERHRVIPYRAPLVRYGKRELVFVVAVKDGEALYYEDVEDGFNLSPLSESGEILQHWCNQDDLQYALRHWTPGVTTRGRRGPATPLK